MLEVVLKRLSDAGGKPYLVGGCVRDKLLGMPLRDIDVEVYGLTWDQTKNALNEFSPEECGKSFGVFKLNNGIDVSLPRAEYATGERHRDFVVHYDPNMSTWDACLRRDFTINAILYDPILDTYTDHFGGVDDLRARELRVTCPTYFEQDPLRVLRGFQLAGRYDLTIGDSVSRMGMGICRSKYNTISRERVWEEWKKWALLSTVPSRGLDLLLKTGWIDLYPGFSDLVNEEQDTIYHPEGSVWEHTKMVCDKMSDITKNCDETTRLVGMFSALFHDIGKPQSHSVGEDGRIHHYKHEQFSQVIALADMIVHLGATELLSNKVSNCVRYHMLKHGINHRAIRKLSVVLEPATFEELLLIFEADGSRELELMSVRSYVDEYNVLKGKPKPILMGRHLIEVGFKEGPEIGRLLAEVYLEQINGYVTTIEEGLEYVKKRTT